MVEKKSFKSGFAVIVGRSNAGKSTLLNSLIGTKLAIITEKAQTTRQPIRGILHDARGQIVFVDTPGVLLKSRDRLTKALNQRAKESLDGVDVIVYLVDPTKEIGAEEQILLKAMEKLETPKILAINKIDLRNPRYIDDYRDLAPQFDATIEISALNSQHLKSLVTAVFEHLPEGEPYYPEFQLTDIDNKFWFAEIIREKIFHQFYQEVPYNINVKVDEMETRPARSRPAKGAATTATGRSASNGVRENGLLYIHAIIEVADERYKKIILGKGGMKIKEIGSSARHDLESVTGTKIFLDLEVEKNPRWVERI